MNPPEGTEPTAPGASPPRPWPASDTPTFAGRIPTPPEPRQPQRARAGQTTLWGALWGGVGFVLGVALTAILALALLTPATTPTPTSPPATGAPLKVTMTDALINQALNTAPTSGAFTLTQTSAHIYTDGRINISGVLSGSSIASGSSVTLVANPYVSQNTLRITVTRASIHGLALPAFALTAIQDQINQQLAGSSRITLGSGSSLVVSGLSFADGAMTIGYTAAAS